MSDGPVILCPGQGAQAVGMGRAWFERSTAAARTFAAADEVLGERLGVKLSEVCFHGPAGVLNRTDVAQPALFTVGVASLQSVFADMPAESLGATAGLSLGEYTALVAAGSISFAEGLELVALRGSAMQAAAEATASSMVALVGADEARARAVCEKAAGDDVLVPANFNAPGQVVISGHASACDRAESAASELGLRATRLQVAGAFHSPIMAPAAEKLGAALERAEVRPPRCRVVSNVTALPHGEAPGDDADVAASIRRRLVEQLTAPVRWAESCAWLVGHVGGEYHELAPGKVLAGLMRRVDRKTKVQSHDEPTDEA